jgi:hypothetical protein
VYRAKASFETTVAGERRKMVKRLAPRLFPVLGLFVMAACVASVSAGAAGPVASGLANPRGIALGPGGRILVAEAATGAIDEIRKGHVRTLATVAGAVDVIGKGRGKTYAAIAGVAPDEPPPPPGPV